MERREPLAGEEGVDVFEAAAARARQWTLRVPTRSKPSFSWTTGRRTPGRLRPQEDRLRPRSDVLR